MEVVLIMEQIQARGATTIKKKKKAKGRFVNIVKNDQIIPEQDKRSLKREIPGNKGSR